MASVFKRKRKVKLDNGKIVIKRSQKYYTRLVDENGIKRTIPLYRDKTASLSRALHLKTEIEQAKEGLIDRYRKDRKKPLREHLEDFRSFLESKGNTKGYIAQTLRRVNHIFDDCEYVFWNDISASQVMNSIAGIKHRGKNLSSQTFNYYLQSVKQFCRWMVQDRRAGDSPVEHLQNITVVPTFERRAATPDEIRRLLEAAEASPKRFGLTGHERSILYRFAAETGLRSKEIRTLKVTSFDFGDCIVMTPAGYTRNKEKIAQPLRKETVPILKEFLKGKIPNAPAFKMPSKYNVARMLKADLLNHWQDIRVPG